jgi:hypothetical protein
MHHCASRFATGWLLALAGVVSASAQSPAGGEMLLNPHFLPGYQSPSDIACDRSGTCIVTWSFGVFAPDGNYLGSKLAATTVSPVGGMLREKILAEDPLDVLMMTAASGSRFALFWTKSSSNLDLPVYQWFDGNLEPRSGVVNLPVLGEGERLAIDTQVIPGGFVQLISGFDIQMDSEGVFLGFVDLNGNELHPTVRVSESAEGEQRAWFGGLAVDVTSGIITVVYEQIRESDSADIFFRRFSLAGELLTPDMRANSYLPDWQTYPALTRGPDGAFVVVWTSAEQDGSHRGIFGQRFTKEGVAIGPEFQVNQVTFSDQTRPRIASDAAGNFVVVWSSYDPSSFGVNDWDVKARLYRADGSPVGPEVFVNRHRENYQDIPHVAFTPNGTIFVAWASLAQVPPANDNITDVFARRFSASRGDEPCVIGNGKFLCDTGRTGGDPEVRHGFGGTNSGFGLLGDVDGDGREDPCVYTGGVFRCDTDHEGGAAEVQIVFAAPGSPVPLLGDVDGDGRADPCLASAGRFSCDTRHDGGSAELVIAFGAAGETLLLGDLDGDGRAEACGYTPGQFRCDTGHNGGSAETVIRFGKRGDQPLLGDFDGDGRDDPCVFRKGVLLCDTAHDGGAAEGTLNFGKTGDRLVLGNLDGL